MVLKRRTVSALLGLASGTLRAKVAQVVDDTGAPVTDEALKELAPGSTLQALGA